MPNIKFYTGSEVDIDNKQIENGAIYFLPYDNDRTTIAYDIDNKRYFIDYPILITSNDLTSTWIPKAGEIIIVTDVVTQENPLAPYIKIGNGITDSVNLPYITKDTNSITVSVSSTQPENEDTVLWIDTSEE